MPRKMIAIKEEEYKELIRAKGRLQAELAKDLSLGDTIGILASSTENEEIRTRVISEYRKVEVRKKSVETPFLTAERYGVEDFETDLDILKNINEIETKSMFLKGIRDRIPDLPHELTSDLRESLIKFLGVLKREIEDDTLRGQCLNILRVISSNYKEDRNIMIKIKELFLERLDELYENLTIDQKSDALLIFQIIHKYELDFMRKLIRDAIEKWSDEEFDRLSDKIGFYELFRSHSGIKKDLRKELWKLRSESKLGRNSTRTKRIDKLIRRIH